MNDFKEIKISLDALAKDFINSVDKNKLIDSDSLSDNMKYVLSKFNISTDKLLKVTVESLTPKFPKFNIGEEYKFKIYSPITNIDIGKVQNYMDVKIQGIVYDVLKESNMYLVYLSCFGGKGIEECFDEEMMIKNIIVE